MKYYKQILLLGISFFGLLHCSSTFALSDKFEPFGKYAGQAPIGITQIGQTMFTSDHARNTMGMKGDLSNEIGIKWKLFTTPISPRDFYSGEDINGDGKDDVLFGFGGKLYLGDTSSSTNIWETKVLDIRSVLGVESILGDGSKSIIVALGDDWYIGVINGTTGNLDWISSKSNGPVKTVKPGWPGLDYKVFDIDGDGIREYHFKQWYSKYNSFRFFASGSIVIGDTLWSSQGYGDYNEGSDGYQPQQWSMGTMSGKLVVGTKGSNTFAFYSNNLNNTLSGALKFQMPAFGKLNVGGNAGAGWSSSLGYFYDVNGDGNDEYISRIDEETNNNKMSRLMVSGLNSSGSMTQFFSLAHPKTLNSSGSIIPKGNFSTPIPLKNYLDLQDSYILSNGRDPVDDTFKWMMFKYNGIGTGGYLKDSPENASFNYNINYSLFNENVVGSPVGIFNNGQKDYVVLLKSGKYSFYTFAGTGTFLTGSTLGITGSFYGNNIFDALDTKREMGKNAGVILAGLDTNGNGLKEFVVTEGNYFKFYEIADSGVTLLKSFGPYNSIPGVIKWGLTKDKKNIYAITYSSVTNVINYYKTDSVNGDYIFSKITNDAFYSGGATRNILISKLGNGAESYNKLMISSQGMYDARVASPSSSPLKIGNDFFHSFDVDADGVNEIQYNGKAYSFNAPGNYALKYEKFGLAGDVNGDGVLDKSWSWCGSSDTYPVNLFYTIQDGKTGLPLVPDLDWGNGNGNCGGGSEYSNASYDIDGDGVDELAAGVAARNTRIISLTGGVITEGNQVAVYNDYHTLTSFDFDGDGKKEIIRGINNAAVFKLNPLNKTQLTNLVNIPGDVKSTFGISDGVPSFIRYNNKTYIAFRGLDGQVSLKSWDGITTVNLFNNYYLNNKKYLNSDEILADNLIPLATSDVYLGDFIGDNTLQVLVGGGDGYIYILSLNGSILKSFNIGASIKKIIFGDTNGDSILDILVSAEDGYIYDLTNSNLLSPLWAKDGQNYGFDIETQTDNKKVTVNYASVSKASGYFIQLYNKTEKSAVFDWINVGNKLKACIISSDVVDPNCTSAGKTFSLNGKSIYEWRVQSYNANVTSPIVISNGFSVLRLAMDKKVAKKEDLNFVDEITVPPNTLVTYKITVSNDSLNTVGGAGFMNFDMMPAQSTSNCTGITDCRTKNIILSDYMPATFTYMPNSTIWIVKKIKYDGSEEIVYGGSQVSDSYFKNQAGTKLITSPGATLAWEFPNTISIPPGGFLELQFDAIARQ